MLPRFTVTDTPNNSWRCFVFPSQHSFKLKGFYQTKIGIPFLSNFLHLNERQSRIIKIAVRIIAAAPVLIQHVLALGASVNVPWVYTKSVVAVVIDVKTLWNLLTSAVFPSLARSQGVSLLCLKLPAAKDQQKRRAKVLDFSFCPKSFNLMCGFVDRPICRATLTRAKITIFRICVTVRAIHGVFSVQDTKWTRLDQQFTAAFRAAFHYNLSTLKIA